MRVASQTNNATEDTMDAQTAVNRYALDPYGSDTYVLTTVAGLTMGAYVPGFGTVTDTMPDDAIPGDVAIRYDVETAIGGTDAEFASMPGEWAIYVVDAA